MGYLAIGPGNISFPEKTTYTDFSSFRETSHPFSNIYTRKEIFKEYILRADKYDLDVIEENIKKTITWKKKNDNYYIVVDSNCLDFAESVALLAMELSQCNRNY